MAKKNGKSISIRKLVKNGEDQLRQAGVLEPETDAFYLWEVCFCKSRAWFWTHSEMEADSLLANRYDFLIKQRAKRIPLQYLTGIQEFMGLCFEVDENVLIPRQDTEILVEEILKDCLGREKVSVLDLCTGSGCIILSLKKLGNLGQAAACDISEKALSIAKKNGEALGVDVNWVHSDLYENIEGSFDILVSNPPYIKTEEIKRLMPEVRKYEPIVALDGDADGLFFYRRIVKGAKERLTSGGRIYFEIGWDQAAAIKELLFAAGFDKIAVIQDLAGLDRVIKAELPRC